MSMCVISIGMAQPLKKTGADTPMMTLSLKRNDLGNGVVMGELYINDKFECFTLEDETTLIPAGTYSVSLYHSPSMNRWVPLIKVPERKWIEIHPGNYPRQSKGCILVGKDHTSTTLLQSKDAFGHLMRQFSLPCVIVVT